MSLQLLSAQLLNTEVRQRLRREMRYLGLETASLLEAQIHQVVTGFRVNRQ